MNQLTTDEVRVPGLDDGDDDTSTIPSWEAEGEEEFKRLTSPEKVRSLVTSVLDNKDKIAEECLRGEKYRLYEKESNIRSRIQELLRLVPALVRTAVQEGKTFVELKPSTNYWDLREIREVMFRVNRIFRTAGYLTYMTSDYVLTIYL